MIVRISNSKRATISISKELQVMLDEVKHTGQSYDGVIRELVMYWNRAHRSKEEARV